MEENNQPTFPMYNELGNLHAEGLTKREYFAGLAMQAIITRHGFDNIGGWDKELINQSINVADELLKQLSRSQ